MDIMNADETFERQTITEETAESVAQIKVIRESVCMGDDADAPNARMIDILETDMLSE